MDLIVKHDLGSDSEQSPELQTDMVDERKDKISTEIATYAADVAKKEVTKNIIFIRTYF